MESRTKSKYARYDSYYGTDRNAALAPVRVPVPQRREQPRPAPKTKTKPKTGKFIALITLAAVVTSFGCVVVSRNAMIYKNNLQIRTLSKNITDAQTMVNTAKLQLADTNVEQYMQVAQSQLNMNYPTAEQLIVIPSPQPEAADNNLSAKTQEKINIYDAILDWINSLERRI